MVRHDAQAHVGGGVLAVLHAADPLPHGHEAPEHVGLIVVGDALHDGGDALQAHARVDVLLGQGLQGAILLAIELGEHAVPVLQEPVAVAAGLAVGTAAAHLGALVEVQLRAGTAGAGGAGAPEVVVLPQTGDVALGHAQALPNLDGLVVVFEDGEVEALCRQAQHLSAELVGPGAHLLLEVFAEAEVAQHLEEAQVAASAADVVDVVGADAFLHGGGADVGGLQVLLLQEVGLELHHACGGEQKRRVIRDEG